MGGKERIRNETEFSRFSQEKETMRNMVCEIESNQIRRKARGYYFRKNPCKNIYILVPTTSKTKRIKQKTRYRTLLRQKTRLDPDDWKAEENILKLSPKVVAENVRQMMTDCYRNLMNRVFSNCMNKSNKGRNTQHKKN